MLTLVVGGAASGKSEYAERLLSDCDDKLYIATLKPHDDECFAKIARHRAVRRDKGFVTVECFTDLAGAKIPEISGMLLECMSNLVANELFDPRGAKKRAVQEIVRGVETLCRLSDTVVVVSNEIFSDGVAYDLETQNYLAILAQVNCLLAARADHVVELVCGIPVQIK